MERFMRVMMDRRSAVGSPAQHRPHLSLDSFVTLSKMVASYLGIYLSSF